MRSAGARPDAPAARSAIARARLSTASCADSHTQTITSSAPTGAPDTTGLDVSCAGSGSGAGPILWLEPTLELVPLTGRGQIPEPGQVPWAGVDSSAGADCSLGADCCPDSVPPALGVCAGGASGVEDAFVAGDLAEACEPPRAAAGLAFLPGKARAAAAANAPVSTTLPAINQRLIRLSSRSAASRVCVVWTATSRPRELELITPA
jgi:hypothetical protein